MTSDLQAVDEQSLESACQLWRPALMRRISVTGPSFFGLFRNLEGLRNDLQCGIVMACFSERLGLECQKY